MNLKVLKAMEFVIFGVVGVALCSAGYDWYRSRPIMNTENWMPAPEVKETVKIKRIMIPGPKEIVTIEKPVVVEKLKLPDVIAQDANKQILATGEVPPYKGKTSIAAVMDTKEGSTQIIARQQPLPLIAFESEKEIGARGGYAVGKDGSTPRGDIYGRWTFLRVGSAHAAFYGEANTRAEAKAMFDLSYRW